MFVDLIEVFIL